MALKLATPTRHEVLREFVEVRGLSLVMWERKGSDPTKLKGPRDPGWPTTHYDHTQYRENMNVGVKLGVEVQPGRYLADVDFDNVAGVSTARLLPETHFGMGRESKRNSHSFYTTPAPVVLRQFKDHVSNVMVVELRGLSKKGTPCQTMIFPSLHPSGEIVRVEDDGEITHVETSLARRVSLYAVADTLYRHLGHRGFGHEVRLATAGFLLQARVTKDEAHDICVSVAEASGNDAQDAATVVETTAKAYADGEPLKGRTALAEAIGDKGLRVVDQLAKWLEDEVALTPNTVVVEGGKLKEIVDRVERALLESRLPIYQRGGELVTPTRQDAPYNHSGIKRPQGSLVVTRLRETRLTELMAGPLRWVNSRHYLVDPPPKYAHTLTARGQWSFPSLRAIVSAPTLRSDGSLLDTPGFDDETGILLDFDPKAYPEIPLKPTKDDAAACLAQLAHPMRGFPFVDGAAKSVALSAILTALVRPSLAFTPLHAFDAPTAGTGKSKLAGLAAVIAVGVTPPALSQGKSGEENEKRLSTVLMAGDSIILLDNCELPIAGDFLCSMLTESTVQARILGLSERRVLPSSALVLASGNNLTFAGDIWRRTVICRLDAQIDRPDKREFDFNCHAEALAKRHALVVAGLTVLRAYALAGFPEKLKLSAMGSFEDWAWIRGALVWLGYPDPEVTRDDVAESDPRRDELVDVMGVWQEALGSEWIEVGEIAKRADAHAASHGQLGKHVPMKALQDKLSEVACRGFWNSKSVGWWLRRYKDRVVGDGDKGRVFRCEKSSNGQQKWKLAPKEDQRELSKSVVEVVTKPVDEEGM